MNEISPFRSRFEAPEVLFKPELAGVENKGMADTLFDVIQVREI